MENVNPADVSAKIMKVMKEREELAYEQGVKDTLSKLLPQLERIQAITSGNIANIEATLAMDRLVNLDADKEHVEG